VARSPRTRLPLCPDLDSHECASACKRNRPAPAKLPASRRSAPKSCKSNPALLLITCGSQWWRRKHGRGAGWMNECGLFRCRGRRGLRARADGLGRRCRSPWCRQATWSNAATPCCLPLSAPYPRFLHLTQSFREPASRDSRRSHLSPSLSCLVISSSDIHLTTYCCAKALT